MATRTRVVIVDDNKLSLSGYVNAFAGVDETELVADLAHADALTWCQEWRDVDVVVVDAADERLAGDQFPGVAVVRRIRSCQGPKQPTIIVVTGHYLHDGLRHRMARAGADLFFYRRDLYTPERLVDVVVNPQNYRRGVPRPNDASAPRTLGVQERSDVEKLVTYVDEHGLAPALDPRQAARAQPRSRKWMHHRAAIAKTSKIEPLNITTGDTPRSARWPSIRQLRRIWAWAARVEHPYDQNTGRSSDSGR